MNLLRLLLNFVMISLQRIEAGAKTTDQLHHDLGAILGYIMDVQHEGKSLRLSAFEPMIPSEHFDILRSELVRSYNGTNRELNFFTGQQIPKNPITNLKKISPLPTATPSSHEDLIGWINLQNGTDLILAITSAQMTMNLFEKLVDQELEATS
jgi:hypothetical protein